MSRTFTIAIGSDHAGFAYKEAIKAMLLEDGHTVRDFGTYSDAACDYPDFIRPVAQAVARGDFERGIVLGGSGNGEAIVANRERGVRCGLCWTEQLAVWNRSHNDGNVLSIGQRTITDQIFPDRDSKAIQVFSTGGRAQLQKLTIWQLKSIWR